MASRRFEAAREADEPVEELIRSACRASNVICQADKIEFTRFEAAESLGAIRVAQCNTEGVQRRRPEPRKPRRFIRTSRARHESSEITAFLDAIMMREAAATSL